MSFARMAELVDALDSGSSRGNPVEVRFLFRALSLEDKSTKAFDGLPLPDPFRRTIDLCMNLHADHIEY